jgi:hypothetical protein
VPPAVVTAAVAIATTTNAAAATPAVVTPAIAVVVTSIDVVVFVVFVVFVFVVIVAIAATTVTTAAAAVVAAAIVLDKTKCTGCLPRCVEGVYRTGMRADGSVAALAAIASNANYVRMSPIESPCHKGLWLGPFSLIVGKTKGNGCRHYVLRECIEQECMQTGHWWH